MAGGEAVGAEIAGEAQQVGELHALIAAYAGDGRAALHIFVGKALDPAVPEAAFIVEDIMGDAQPVGHGARVVDVLAGTAASGPLHGGAILVELARNAAHRGAGPRGPPGPDRAAPPAPTGNTNP